MNVKLVYEGGLVESACTQQDGSQVTSALLSVERDTSRMASWLTVSGEHWAGADDPEPMAHVRLRELETSRDVRTPAEWFEEAARVGVRVDGQTRRLTRADVDGEPVFDPSEEDD